MQITKGNIHIQVNLPVSGQDMTGTLVVCGPDKEEPRINPSHPSGSHPKTGVSSASNQVLTGAAELQQQDPGGTPPRRWAPHPAGSDG